VVTGALRRPSAKLRSLSHPLVAAPYNSGGFSPARIQGIRRLNRSRSRGFSGVMAAAILFPATALRRYVDSFEPGSGLVSSQAPSALLEQEPPGADSQEPASTIDSTAAPSQINTPVEGH
jgi:hypothetical protein